MTAVREMPVSIDADNVASSDADEEMKGQAKQYLALTRQSGSLELYALPHLQLVFATSVIISLHFEKIYNGNVASGEWGEASRKVFCS